MLRGISALLLLAFSVQAEEFIAFRYNSDHVIFFLGDNSGAPPAGSEIIADAAAKWVERGGAIQKTPLTSVTAKSFDGSIHFVQLGATYTIELTAGASVKAKVDQIVWQEGCGSTYAGALARIRAEDRHEFEAAAEAGLDYYLAEPASPQTIIHGGTPKKGIRAVTLSSEEQVALTAALNSRMKNDLVKLVAKPDTYLRGERPEFWKRRDGALAVGEAQITIKIREVDFGRSLGNRHAIQALWTVENKPAFYIFAWTKPGSAALEMVDSDVSRWMRIPELGEDAGPILDRENCLLNVFDGGKIMMAGTGWESFGLSVLQIDPKQKGSSAEYGDGC